MKINNKAIFLLERLWSQLPKKRKIQFIAVILFIVLTSIIEIISIGSALPFLAVLTNPGVILDNQIAMPILSWLNIDDDDSLLLFATILFSVAIFLSGMMRLSLIWINLKLSYNTGVEISTKIFKSTLYQPYSVHVERNTNEIIGGISAKVNIVINSVINASLNFLSSFLILLTLFIAIFYVDYIVALTAISIFFILYGALLILTKSILNRLSENISRGSVIVLKKLQEGLGGIRDVILQGSQENVAKSYKTSEYTLRNSQVVLLFLSMSPRYAIESIILITMAIVAYNVAKTPEAIISAIPLLGAMVLGAQRMLPLLQQAYSAVSDFRGAKFSLIDTLELLEQPVSEYIQSDINTPLDFNRSISFSNLYFKYQANSDYVLNDINLEIPKGSRVGIIGPSGSGKSTFIDNLMYLLHPTKGHIKIDDEIINMNNFRGLQLLISHVPQTVYLADSSIAENIAFGLDKDSIDKHLLDKAIEQAKLTDVIANLKDGLNTIVGERGVKLSGGQRQRIGIARALYKASKIIIFDEATSSLDTETEKKVMDAINNIDMSITIFVVAHRISTLESCSKIIEMNKGRVERICSYEDIK